MAMEDIEDTTEATEDIMEDTGPMVMVTVTGSCLDWATATGAATAGDITAIMDRTELKLVITLHV